MARTLVGGSVAAGNATLAVIYTAPVNGASAIIGNITAYNSTGGGLTLTLAIGRQDGTNQTVAVELIATVSTASYSGGSTRRVTPLVLLSGETLKAQGSGAGITVTFSGVKFS